MRHLFSPEGELALATLARTRPLLAFDFDGTLAPIVARPDDARVPLSVSRRLARLAHMRPLAIVTGRRIADVLPRLAFTPTYVVGNHGAEKADAAHDSPPSAALQAVRQHLASASLELDRLGITLEDKGHSLALHYRLARDRERARTQLEGFARTLGPALRVFGGKHVLNVVDADAPDKAAAMYELVERSGSGAALFVGDDLNDEAVFERAPPEWLTVRVGRDDPSSRARWFLDGQAEMVGLLERLIRALETAEGAASAPG
jgi:trehalose 6-phosphate phosphatase